MYFVGAAGHSHLPQVLPFFKMLEFCLSRISDKKFRGAGVNTSKQRRKPKTGLAPRPIKTDLDSYNGFSQNQLFLTLPQNGLRN